MRAPRNWKDRLAWNRAFARRVKREGWSPRRQQLHRASFAAFRLRDRIAIMRYRRARPFYPPLRSWSR